MALISNNHNENSLYILQVNKRGKQNEEVVNHAYGSNACVHNGGMYRE